MCGRFYINDRDPVLRRLYDQLRSRPGFELLKAGEICPTDVIPVLVQEGGKLVPRPMVWGFPKWDGKGCIFNARSETVAQKPMFRRAFLGNPAIVPCSGFYEWQAVPGQKKKDRYIFNLPEQRLVFLAAFWSAFPDQAGPLPERVTILTTAANESMAPYHHRMPVILHHQELERWARGGHQGVMVNRLMPALTAERAECA